MYEREVARVTAIRLTESDRQMLSAAARRAGITRSELIRQAARKAAEHILAKGGRNATQG